MKKLLVSLVALVVLVGLVASGCQSVSLAWGNGVITDREYDYQGFTDIEVSSSFSVEIRQSDSYSVVVSTHENLIDRLDIVLSGDTLKLRIKPGSYHNSDLKAVVTLPELKRFALSGASQGDIRGFQSDQAFDLTVSGASQLKLDMQSGPTNIKVSGASKVSGDLVAQGTRFDISGASRCELNGSAGDTDLKVSGASQTLLANFPAQNIDLEVSGASRAIVATDSILNVNVSGASSVEYSGNPILDKVSVTGASKLNNR